MTHVLPVRDDWHTAGPDGSKRLQKGYTHKNILRFAISEIAKTDDFLNKLGANKRPHSRSSATVLSRHKAIESNRRFRPKNPETQPLETHNKFQMLTVQDSSSSLTANNNKRTTKKRPFSKKSKKTPSNNTGAIDKPKRNTEVSDPSTNPDFKQQVKNLNLLVRTTQALQNWSKMPDSLTD